ncbi:chitin deacetylase 7 isoform X2 [Panulirus ornatus]|uniref:chitin deacetylase 7 isoform X2 n=1 Tax=Panulirus ornatus TaxID=150431 RepID=UPI003A851550
MITTISTLLLLFVLGTTEGQSYTCPYPEGQFASEENCKVFYQCVGGNAYRRTCAEGSLYDGSKHMCVNSKDPSLKCGPQPEEEKTTKAPDPYEAGPCDPIECLLPYCFCSYDGTEIPGGLKPAETPQMIMMTFDGAINDLNFETYNKIFLDNRTSPNGCPIRATFFVSHDYTNYQHVEKYYSRGHEIAVGSISRRRGLEDEGEDVWIGEMVTMKEILQNFAGVRAVDIKGQRGPHLKPGREAQYEVLSAYGFTWDSTVSNPPGSTAPVWPYSLDYKIPHECRSGTCPTRSFPGVWELPMNSHYQDRNYNGGFCQYLDQCVLNYLEEADVVEWLIADFERHYNGNRAPYMMSLTTNWFQTPVLESALHTFIDYTMRFDDVYYTTVTEALQWVTTPQKLNVLNNFQPWDCRQKYYPDPPCPKAKSCKLTLKPLFDNYTSSTASRYMVTCRNCPEVYPWVWDASGQGRLRDNYQFFSTGREEGTPLEAAA